MSDALATITGLFRYPVKSLSGEALDSVELTTDQCLPGDRLYALSHGAGKFDPANPEWVSKAHFANLAKQDIMAKLDTHYDPETTTLTIHEAGATKAEGRLDSEDGRASIEAFLNPFFEGKLPPPVKIVRAGYGALTDQEEPLISVINLATLKDLERVMEQPIDHRRFRGNILVDTGEAWSERKWVGRDIQLGAAKAVVVDNIDRCAAINIAPETRAKNMNLPAHIVRTFGHMDCGVFIRIKDGGAVLGGDTIQFAG